MPQTVAFLNKKGGVGKTSTVHHLGGELARRGLKILLADVDPQASLTKGLLTPDVAESLDPAETIAALMDPAGGPPAATLVRPTPFENLAILPGSEAAEDYNVPRAWETGDDQFILRDAIQEAEVGFDLVLIDCPPHIQFWAWSALVAANGVVVPVQAEDYGAQGLKAIRRVLGHVRREANADLALIGYLITMYSKIGIHATYEAALRANHHDDVFAAMVPHTKDFKEAVTKRKPVCWYKPKSVSTRAVAALADEFLARLAGRLGSDARRVA